MKFYLVGGAVRDRYMGNEEKDHDFVVVGSSVDEMLSLGFKLIEAQSFPVFHHPVTGHEYALARRERKTGDGYHGFEVETNAVTLEEDLSRRDFRMNAMAMRAEVNIQSGDFIIDDDFIDPFDGSIDIENEMIRHVSGAFKEDPVRVLRAARFAARYGFGIEYDTRKIIRDMVKEGMLDNLTKERVWLEMSKAMTEKYPFIFFRNIREFKAHHIIHDMPFHWYINEKEFLSVDQKFAFTVSDYEGDPEDIDEIYVKLGAPNSTRILSNRFIKIRRELDNWTGDVDQIVRIIDTVDGFRNPKNTGGIIQIIAAHDPDLLSHWSTVIAAIGIASSINHSDVDTTGLKGRAIGEAIRQARIQKIGRVLFSQ